MDLHPKQIESQRLIIEKALTNILSDRRFKSSPQMSAFLRYIVEQTLDGHANRIKAYTIAVDALGKPDSFDPQSNPSVRVLARRLRTSLLQYYSQEGNNSETVISIKLGSYVPSFSTQKSSRSSLVKKDHLNSKFIHSLKLATKWKDNISNVYNTYHRRITLLGLMFIALLTWTNLIISTTNKEKQREWELPQANQELPLIDIASMENIDIFVKRPSTPIILITKKTGNSLDPEGKLLYNAINDYENVTIVIEKQDTNKTHTAWPEQYELQYSENTDKTIKTILMHSQTNTIVHTENLAFKKINESEKLATIQLFGKNLANVNGILMSDYRKRGMITPTMECVFLFDDYYQDKTHFKHKAARQCSYDLQEERFSYPDPFTL